MRERERERQECHVHMLSKQMHTHTPAHTHTDFERYDTGYLVEDHSVKRSGDGQEVGGTGGRATELGEVKGRHPCRRLLHLQQKHTYMYTEKSKDTIPAAGVHGTP
jgi:hypothetical protein